MILAILLIILLRIAIVDRIWFKRLDDVYDYLIEKAYSGDLNADLAEIDREYDSIPSVFIMFIDIRKWTYKHWFGEKK